MLILRWVEWGFSSNTYNFRHACQYNGRLIPGGRLAFMILGLFVKEKKKKEIYYGHGYEEARKMQADIDMGKDQ